MTAINISKTEYFEYFVKKIYDSNNFKELNDLSIVKVQKLLFFLTTSVQDEEGNYPLLNIFSAFYALPYGHVESDIYNAIKSDNLNYFKITRFGTNLKTFQTFHFLNNKITALIDEGFHALKEYNLLKRNASYLVDLSHCHESWIKNYRQAINENKFSRQIPVIDIAQEKKYFAL
jgi:uncharacterized phage-associated protein